jgi:hypothetical protein
MPITTKATECAEGAHAYFDLAGRHSEFRTGRMQHRHEQDERADHFAEDIEDGPANCRAGGEGAEDRALVGADVVMIFVEQPDEHEARARRGAGGATNMGDLGPGMPAAPGDRHRRLMWRPLNGSLIWRP